MTVRELASESSGTRVLTVTHVPTEGEVSA